MYVEEPNIFFYYGYSFDQPKWAIVIYVLLFYAVLVGLFEFFFKSAHEASKLLAISCQSPSL